jgi:nucleoid DNA-binding protein
MQKRDLAQLIADKYKLPKADALGILDFIFETILAEVRDGGFYKHWGFGRFELVTRVSRKIRAIHQDNLTVLPKRLGLKFFPSRQLNKDLNS